VHAVVSSEWLVRVVREIRAEKDRAEKDGADSGGTLKRTVTTVTETTIEAVRAAIRRRLQLHWRNAQFTQGKVSLGGSALQLDERMLHIVAETDLSFEWRLRPIADADKPLSADEQAQGGQVAAETVQWEYNSLSLRIRNLTRRPVAHELGLAYSMGCGQQDALAFAGSLHGTLSIAPGGEHTHTLTVCFAASDRCTFSAHCTSPGSADKSGGDRSAAIVSPPFVVTASEPAGRARMSSTFNEE